ncbi:hypothetical protein Fcan01_16432 [Folsomia candida]|uniref:Uncharacterized protein n=2 Tax=Folsomia candida TaxID=158441 RepID=A0A226DUQ8_FOLCA|nr:hypothetical protein Fcan01_16432 [Folsomia candida]
MDPKRGLIFPKLTYSPVITAKIKRLTDKFKSYWGQLSQSGALEMGYNSAAANEKLDELSMPIDKWLSGHNLSELIPLFYPPITAQGYGDVRNIAVLYAMKLIVAEDIELLTLIGDNTAFQVKEGFDTFVHRIAETVRDKYLGWRAVRIERLRQTGTQQVTFRVGNFQIVRTCGKTILAFPPLLGQVATLLSDINWKEKHIFSQVKVHKYMTSGNDIPNLQRNVYLGLVPISRNESRDIIPELIPYAGDGEVVAFTKQMKGTRPYYTGYSWIYGDYTDPANGADIFLMLTKLTGTLRKIHPFSRTLFTSVTDYFPHVTGQSIRDGFYRDFESIQGDGGLYFATTLLTFETVNGAIEMGEKFVDKYF